MAGTRAAIRYAKAVLSLASDNKQAAAVQADMTHIGQAIADNASLEAVLKSPVVKLSEKADVLKAIFPSVSAESKSLFNILVTPIFIIPLKKLSNAKMVNLIGNQISYHRKSPKFKDNEFFFDYLKKEHRFYSSLSIEFFVFLSILLFLLFSLL